MAPEVAEYISDGMPCFWASTDAEKSEVPPGAARCRPVPPGAVGRLRPHGTIASSKGLGGVMTDGVELEGKSIAGSRAPGLRSKKAHNMSLTPVLVPSSGV